MSPSLFLNFRVYVLSLGLERGAVGPQSLGRHPAARQGLALAHSLCGQPSLWSPGTGGGGQYRVRVTRSSAQCSIPWLWLCWGGGWPARLRAPPACLTRVLGGAGAGRPGVSGKGFGPQSGLGTIWPQVPAESLAPQDGSPEPAGQVEGSPSACAWAQPWCEFREMATTPAAGGGGWRAPPDGQLPGESRQNRKVPWLDP